MTYVLVIELRRLGGKSELGGRVEEREAARVVCGLLLLDGDPLLLLQPPHVARPRPAHAAVTIPALVTWGDKKTFFECFYLLLC